VGTLLTTADILLCPHGAPVQAVPAGQQVSAGGATVLSAADSFVIAGCPFTIGPVPHPCVTVTWAATNTGSTAGGAATLSTDSVGLAVGADQAVQGPVSISPVQTRALGR
jgi:hypothetical protein